MSPGGGKANVLVVPSCHSCLNNNDGGQSRRAVFHRPNLLVLRLLSLHQQQRAGSQAAAGPLGAREKLAGGLEGECEVWTLP